MDNVGALPATSRRNTCILLVTDRFSRRGDMSAVTAAEFTAEGMANVLINRHIPLWGCPCSIQNDIAMYLNSAMFGLSCT